MIRFAFTAGLVLLSGSAFGQPPYAGMQARPIKALSEQQVADLAAGRGMGLALAAELNGYPGPSHVLELADDGTGNLPDAAAEMPDQYETFIRKGDALAVQLRVAFGSPGHGLRIDVERRQVLVVEIVARDGFRR